MVPVVAGLVVPVVAGLMVPVVAGLVVPVVVGLVVWWFLSLLFTPAALTHTAQLHNIFQHRFQQGIRYVLLG